LPVGAVIETALDGVGVGAAPLLTSTVTEFVASSRFLESYALIEIVWEPFAAEVESHEKVYGGLDFQ